MLHDIVRKIWRLILLMFNGAHSTILIVVSFVYYYFVYIFVIFFRNRNNEGYLIGIQELCSNIKTTKDSLITCGIKNVTSLAIINSYDKDYTYDHSINIPSWLDRYHNLKKYYVFICTFIYYLIFT